ncbi:unnamed protein product [Rangifer tarandus platyrhynchus]|uniref:Uncharacterized protein n=2 Tax=Rangifer tarandus platyrhynchus TaxID=3082113 RepID=A0ACB0F117_RANTA|nr:unnamed protein product [Rangifer tarandus platyrhynchus]CAI9706582.1 unnamed protein product [Rangifer tarandus platyrhynchus]
MAALSGEGAERQQRDRNPRGGNRRNPLRARINARHCLKRVTRRQRLKRHQRRRAGAGVGAGAGRPDAEDEGAPRARPSGRPPQRPRLASPPPRKTAASPPVLPTPLRMRSGLLTRTF